MNKNLKTPLLKILTFVAVLATLFMFYMVFNPINVSDVVVMQLTFIVIFFFFLAALIMVVGPFFAKDVPANMKFNLVFTGLLIFLMFLGMRYEVFANIFDFLTSLFST